MDQRQGLHEGPLELQGRRAWLRHAAAVFGASLLGHAQDGRKPIYAYVGCFTTEQRHGHGDGIHVYSMDAATGAWEHLQRAGRLVNPSFLVLARDNRFLYSSHGDQDYATSFKVDRSTGRLERLNQASTGGENGAHLAIDPSGKFLLVANYGSGTVAVLPVGADGALTDQIQLMPLEGPHGPHPTEQTSSHPHQILFDGSGRFVIVPDKGLDRIFVFRFDPAAGKLSATKAGFIATKPGAGPRHGAFHPSLPVVWILNELDSTTATYHWDSARGDLSQLQVVSSLPRDVQHRGGAAEIVVSRDGRFVYCSNRGHDSVVIYEADRKTGLLGAIDWIPTQGKSPRFIQFDPTHRFFFAANEQSDTIVSWRVDGASGRLTPAGQTIHDATPVTIAFAAEAGRI